VQRKILMLPLLFSVMAVPYPSISLCKLKTRPSTVAGRTASIGALAPEPPRAIRSKPWSMRILSFFFLVFRVEPALLWLNFHSRCDLDVFRIYCSLFLLMRLVLCCSVLQCVAVCCSVLQCVAVCCSQCFFAHLEEAVL